MSDQAISFDERLIHAADAGDPIALALALAGGADPKAQCSHALRLAAGKGRAECVKLLLPVSDPQANHCAALGQAALYGHAECVCLLLPLSDPKDSQALLWAAQFGHAECVAILLPVSDPRAQDQNGDDALALARICGHSHVAAMIEAFNDAHDLSASVASPRQTRPALYL